MTPSPLPAALGVGILHLGLGAFHRAHQAAFTQDAIAAAGGDWGIEAISMRNPALAETLTDQGGRYTLIERHPEGPRLREMTVIRSARALPGHEQSITERMADPAIRIVTITVTEKGYGADIGARRLDRANPAVAHDLTHPEAAPRSLVGLILAGLAARQAAGHGGLTLMSCDNLPENGDLLDALVRELARETRPDLVGWIARTCRFPDSMVDRITPAASEETRAIAQAALGHPDPAAVETEPFRQWVIEDRFAGDRPAWEKAGAQIVPDVAPFETMKLRLLNGAHSLIAYLGAVAGLSAVRDVMADPILARVVRAHMRLAAETLAPAAGLDPVSYTEALMARFANPAIDHRCLQIAMDGSQKLPQRIFAPARAQLDAGHGIGTFALATAAWLRFAEGRDENGTPLALNDPLASGIRAALANAGPRPEDRAPALAILPSLAHQGVLADPRFLQEVADLLQIMDRHGVRAAAEAAMQP
jgi:fructuronate reductase